ncbi:kinase-like domain-containing protein [Rhodocollybia butyracea]|uniref:Kinase-like domain-containing protein n=1 Tax=Rhodocollybia butyracea TaxID=206335 RepID=A0A9P5PPX2_9AGAR|nr:kinase-like domain-containing protein [Rhodocollybia butyracea]
MPEPTSSEPSSPQDIPHYSHQYARSEPSFLGVSVTPPTPFINLGWASTSLSPPGTSLNLHALSRTPSLGSGRGRSPVKDKMTTASQSSSRESSADSHTSTDTNHSWRKIFNPRGWRSSDSSPSREHVPVPREKSDAYLRTGMRVQDALKSIGEVTRLGLQVVADTGELIPVPGLRIIARLLTGIWEAVDDVGSDRFACLRLTGRCADFLLAITEEVHERGDQVTAELHKPLEKLERAFQLIWELMQEIRDQPFWKRFLDRDEIHADIETCHESLNDCMILFNISILTRILGNVSGPSNQLVGTHPSIPIPDDSHETHEAELPPVDDDPGLNQLLQFSPAALPADDSALTDADRLQEQLRCFQERQNELDKAADMNDLRQLLSAALNTNDDTDMQKVLQVASKDMLKAIRTLLAVLEGRDPHWRPSPSSAMRSKQLPHTRAFTWPLSGREGNILDGDHIESGIARLVQWENETTLPSWIVEKSDVSFQELIGKGFFSNVYKGTWRHRTVAIKVLEQSTKREAFLSEIDVWKSFRHPNILRLYGTSDPYKDNTWFLVSPYMRNGSLPEYLKRLEWDGSMIMGSSMVSEVYGDSSIPDLLRFMHEISQAMEYLHSMHVIHGDLKGANVLLDNDRRCVLSDFGQSRHHAKISYKDPKHAHGFRWQSPELMSGRGFISKENDVYAFAITCVEIVTMGSLPWPTKPDDVVKIIVLEQNGRPPFPSKIVDRLGVLSLLENCWHDEFGERPTFSKVVKDLETLVTRLAFYRPELSPTPPPQSLPLPNLYTADPQQMEGTGDSVLLPPASEDYTSPSRSNTIRPVSARIKQ